MTMIIAPEVVDRPPKSDAELKERRLFLAEQLDVVMGLEMPCSCGKRVHLFLAYRCIECGLWFCKACAERHYNDEISELTRAELRLSLALGVAIESMLLLWSIDQTPGLQVDLRDPSRLRQMTQKWWNEGGYTADDLERFAKDEPEILPGFCLQVQKAEVH